MKRSFLPFLLVMISGLSFAQIEQDTTSTLNKTLNDSIVNMIEYNDIGFIWMGEGYGNSRLGFISDDYQRIRIRFLSVIQNYDNPFEYFIYGKSKVGENICEFQGSVYIRETGLIDEGEDSDFLQAFISGDYVLYEDPNCIHSGIFSGEFLNRIYFDEYGDVYYDDLNMEQDGYSNSLFRGTWFNYDNGETITCNWGDFRIPDSEEPDVGSQEFHPSFRYLDKGWKEYLEQNENEQETEVWWD